MSGQLCLRHIAASTISLDGADVQVCVQPKQKTAEAAVRELLPQLESDPSVFLRDVFKMMQYCTNMHLQAHTLMGVECNDAGWHNLSFAGPIIGGRLGDKFVIKWLDWENNRIGSPSRSSLNKAVARMFASIGAVASEAKSRAGGRIGGALAARGNPKWHAISDDIIAGRLPDDNWLSRYFEDLYRDVMAFISVDKEKPKPVLLLPSDDDSSSEYTVTKEKPQNRNLEDVIGSKRLSSGWGVADVVPVAGVPALDDSSPTEPSETEEQSVHLLSDAPKERVEKRSTEDLLASPQTASSSGVADAAPIAGVTADVEMTEEPQMTLNPIEDKPTTSWGKFWASSASHEHAPQSPATTPRGQLDPCERAVCEMKKQYADTSYRGKQARKMRARGQAPYDQSDGGRQQQASHDPRDEKTHQPGGARHPKWVMDIVAMFLMSFHVSIGSYCRERCYLRNDRRGKKPRTSFPKTYYDALPFIVNNHAKTVDAIIQGRSDQSTAPNWLMDQDWLDVKVMREVATTMLSRFVHRQVWDRATNTWQWKQPIGAYDWDNMYLFPHEVETIATTVIRGYLAAGPREIQEAATALEHK